MTVVARGNRLEQLRQAKAIEDIHGNRALVQVADVLDAGKEWDLVLVTVLSYQIEALLPALASSSAKKIMLMFNTFQPLDYFSKAVGPSRFAFGFPAVVAKIEEGRLKSKIVTRGYLTVATDPTFAKIFTDSGIPTVLQNDMGSWLRTHAAVIVPIMAISHRAYQKRAGVSWAEASGGAKAMSEGFDLVRRLGNQVTPKSVELLSGLPLFLIALILWAMSRIKAFRDLGPSIPNECRALIDEMNAVSGGRLQSLLSIRT